MQVFKCTYHDKHMLSITTIIVFHNKSRVAYTYKIFMSIKPHVIALFLYITINHLGASCHLKPNSAKSGMSDALQQSGYDRVNCNWEQ